MFIRAGSVVDKSTSDPKIRRKVGGQGQFHYMSFINNNNNNNNKKKKGKVKCSRYRPGVAQRVGRGEV